MRELIEKIDLGKPGDGHTKFVSDTIAYEVYMRLMTSAGKKYKQAGLNTPLQPVLNVQIKPLQAEDY